MTEKLHSPEGISRPLSYEEFAEGRPIFRYNNFYLYFIDVPDNIRRMGEHGQRLQKLREENPELERILTDALTRGYIERRSEETRRQLEPQLYEAYLIMRKHVTNDEELFS